MEKSDIVIKELTHFPNLPHDDIVDSCTNFLNWYLTDWVNLQSKKDKVVQFNPTIRRL